MHAIVTSYKEPKATVRAVKILLSQLGKSDKLTVVDPFPEVEEYLFKEIKDKRVDFFLDPGEGKGYALNLLFQERGTGKKDDVWVLTDGDVYVKDNAIEEIKKGFKDKKIGCVTCRPIALDKDKSKFEYWSWVAFQGIDKTRTRLSKEKKFFECTGYLFAIRQGVINDFPIETSEDSIIPYLFWKKGYKIKYARDAEVYVKNPNNWKDYLNQKVRNIKAHENLDKIAKNMPRTKSFMNEVKEGALFAIMQPKSLKELIWVIEFYFARLWIYINAFGELKKGDQYGDGWRETEIKSTKPLD
jgi:cellulose synthase/poly-beta-1,6-N-acetylglucosamine synthase-like glycosyltransferase